MKLYCRNSGISFDVQYGGFIKEASYVHPIFHMPVSQLLKQRGAWFTGRIENEMDKRLLFLSLLNSSELIEFSHPAEPSAKTVAVNMPRLFDLVDWMVRLRSPFIVLPSYRVSGDNRSLDNIRYWLDSWQAERIRFEDGYRKWDKDKIQADRENALERSIKNPTKRSEQYARLLSRWAFDASDAPINKRELWTSIFLLRTPAIYSYNTNLIQEMHDFLEIEMPAGSIYAAVTLRHVRSLLSKAKNGYSAALGFSSDDDDDNSLLPYAMDDNIQNTNMLAIASAAPLNEPQRNMYPTDATYLRARIAWNMKQQLMEKPEILEAPELKEDPTLDKNNSGNPDSFDNTDEGNDDDYNTDL